ARFHLHGPFVDLRRSDLKAQASRRENLATNVTPRSKHERLGSKPKHHGHATGCRRRSLNSRITAAAVSSIDRRLDEPSDRVTGSRVSARYVRDWHTARPQAVVKDFPRQAPPLRQGPTAH